MAQKEKDKKSLKALLEQISKIVAWFEAQEELDLEEALLKIKEAGELIKTSKAKLAEIDNEFKEIKKDLEE